MPPRTGEPACRGRFTLEALGLELLPCSVDVQDEEQQHEAVDDTTGGDIWGASVAMALAFAADPALVQDKVVLEVGCGSGLAGLAAAAVGATCVTLTDGVPSATTGAKRNIAAHSHFAWADRCKTAQLTWGDEATATTLAHDNNVELIIGADVGCYPDSQAALATTLRAAAKAAGQHAAVLLAEEIRWKDVHGWFRDELTKAGFVLVSERRLSDSHTHTVLLHLELSPPGSVDESNSHI